MQLHPFLKPACSFLRWDSNTDSIPFQITPIINLLGIHKNFITFQLSHFELSFVFGSFRNETFLPIVWYILLIPDICKSWVRQFHLCLIVAFFVFLEGCYLLLVLFQFLSASQPVLFLVLLVTS